MSFSGTGSERNTLMALLPLIISRSVSSCLLESSSDVRDDSEVLLLNLEFSVNVKASKSPY